MAERSSKSGGKGGVLEALPTDQLSEEFHHLVSALAEKAMSGASARVGSLTDRLTDLAENGGSKAKTAAKAGGDLAEGKSPLKSALSAGAEGIRSTVGEVLGGGGKGGKGGKGDKHLKVTDIVEEIDIGAPVRVVYDQWTQFQDFSHFMKKVEDVDQKEEQKIDFKAQVLWSHRSWQATIVDQVPDKRIVWRSKGDKGHVDGAVTFHEIGPDLTRVLVVLEYHPQGLVERTGNLWRAQGRRVRLELKHFRRHVMTHALLHPDELEGWRGEIHESKVTRSHDDALAEEEDEGDEEAGDYEDEYDDQAGEEEDEDEEEGDEEEGDAEGYEDEYEDETDEDEDEEEGDEEEGDAESYEDEYEDEADEDEDEGDDEYEDEDDEDDQFEAEYEEEPEDEEEDEEPDRPRRRARAGRR